MKWKGIRRNPGDLSNRIKKGPSPHLILAASLRQSGAYIGDASSCNFDKSTICMCYTCSGVRTSACSASRCFHIPDDRPSRELKGKIKLCCCCTHPQLLRLMLGWMYISQRHGPRRIKSTARRRKKTKRANSFFSLFLGVWPFAAVDDATFLSSFW